MKSAFKCYINIPNVAKVRSRIENPSKEFSAKVKDAAFNALVEIINENQLSFKSKMIDAINKSGETITKAQVDKVNNVMNDFFAVQASLKNDFGSEAEEGVATEAPADFED